MVGRGGGQRSPGRGQPRRASRVGMRRRVRGWLHQLVLEVPAASTSAGDTRAVVIGGLVIGIGDLYHAEW